MAYSSRLSKAMSCFIVTLLCCFSIRAFKDEVLVSPKFVVKSGNLSLTLPPGYQWQESPAFPTDARAMWTDGKDDLTWASIAHMDVQLRSASIRELISVPPHGPLRVLHHPCSLMVLGLHFLACSGLSVYIHVLSISTFEGNELPEITFRIPSRPRALSRVTALMFLKSDILAAGTNVGFVYLFNTSDIIPHGATVPCQTLDVGAVVSSLAVLDASRLAVGTNDGSIELFDVSTLDPGGRTDPVQILHASDMVVSLAALDAVGLAAGTYDGSIDLFNMSALDHGGPTAAFQTIHTSKGKVSCLAVLSDNRLAASNGASVYIFNTSDLQTDGPKNILKIFDVGSWVSSMAVLNDKVLAVGNIAFSVELFDITAMSPAPLHKLHASNIAWNLVVLDENGLAVGTHDTIDLFNMSALNRGIPEKPIQVLHASGDVASLTVLDNGGLVVGTDARTVDLFNISALHSDGPKAPFQILRVSRVPMALAVLREKGLVAGTGSNVEFFNNSSLQLGGPTAPSHTININSTVSSLAVLDATGLAVGTNKCIVEVFNTSALHPSQNRQRFDTSRWVRFLVALDDEVFAAATGATVELFNLSALTLSTPTPPFQTLHASNEVSSLAVLDDKGLAAGTRHNTVELFRKAALDPGGSFQTLQSSKKLHTTFQVHGSGPIFFHVDSKQMPCWFIGSSFVRPVACPATTFKVNSTNCNNCPSAMSSLDGEDWCTFPRIRICIFSFGAAVVYFILPAIILVAICQRWRAQRRIVWSSRAEIMLRLIPWFLAALMVGLANITFDWFKARVFAVMVTVRCVVGLAKHVQQDSACQISLGIAAIAQSMVVVSAACILLLESISESKEMQVVTPLGYASVGSNVFVLLFCVCLPLAETLSEMLLLVSLDLSRSSQPIELHDAVQDPTFYSSEMECRDDGQEVVVTRCTCTCNALRVVPRKCLNLCRLLNTWEGRHSIFIAHGVVNILLLLEQVVTQKVMAAGEGVLLWAIAFAVGIVLSSLLSLNWSRWFQATAAGEDRNFRRAVLFKGCLLSAKSVLLTFPESSEVVHVRYLWSCVQSLCPSSCAERFGGGRCVPLNGECRCQSSRPQILVVMLMVATSILMSSLTIVDFSLIVRRNGHAMQLSNRHLVGIFACNVVHPIGLLLATILPITALSSRPGTAGLFSLPLIALSLLINEFKWIVHAWSPKQSNVPAVRENGGLKIVLPICLMTIVVALIILCEELINVSKQPSYIQPFGGQYTYVICFGVVTLVFGAMSSLLLMY